MGHSKQINACDLRPCRPFRAVTCSDDKAVSFFTGAPYKFSSSFKEHTRFVNSVKYSPNGELFASAGSDGKVIIEDLIFVDGEVDFRI